MLEQLLRSTSPPSLLHAWVMKMSYPDPPAGFSLTELRCGNANVLSDDGTQARRRRREAFRSALTSWVEAGGRCDLLPPGNVENSPVAHFFPRLRAMALNRTVIPGVGRTVAPGEDLSSSFGLLGLGRPRYDAAQVPVNLPDAKHHPVILVLGLKAWFDGLSREYARIFLRYLFEFDPDQQSPAPGLFTQALSTNRLIACYDMSGSADRDRFVSVVTWRGLEDEPRTPSAITQVCYEVAVVEHARPAMVEALGSNPWAPAVAAYLLEHVGAWNPNGVELSVCQMPLNSAHLQAHLEESQQGMKVRDLLPLLAGFMRVGAATGDKLALLSDGLVSKTVSVPTLFDERPRADSLVLTYGVFAKIPASSGIAWSPFKTPALILMLGTYESVRLVSADFSISVPMGADNIGYAAITSTGTALKGEDWYGAAYLKMIPGSDQGTVVSQYSLPAVHSFNPELRAAVQGNGPPEFKFSLAGAAGMKMIVTGNFQVRVSGQVVMGSVDISAAAKLRNAVRTVQSSLSYSVADCEVEPPVADAGESDEESDEEAPPATAPVPVTTVRTPAAQASPPRNRE